MKTLFTMNLKEGNKSLKSRNAVKKFFGLTIIFYMILFQNIYSQDRSDKAAELTTWILLQALPSPSFFQDHNIENSGLRFGFTWNISPVNFSFNANKLISPVSFFKVNPVRRYGGSVELFFQPQWMTGEYEYSDLSRFHFKTGFRGYIPLLEDGERLALSGGFNYSLRKKKYSGDDNAYAVEFGIYSFFGIIGLKFDYYLNGTNKYAFGINLKYY